MIKEDVVRLDIVCYVSVVNVVGKYINTNTYKEG